MPLFGPPNMGKLATKRDVKGLIRALRYRKDAEIRQYAANALSWAGDARAVGPLIAALQDPDRGVARSAIHALGELGDPQAVEPLIALLHNRDLNAQAVEALAKVVEASTLGPLLAALQDPNSSVREGVAMALGNIHDDAAVRALIAALQDRDWQVRQSAAESLGRIGNTNAVEALVLALGDDRPAVRWRAAASLGEIGDRRAFAALADAIQDAQPVVRARAAMALGAIGEPRAAQALVPLLGDGDDSVRKAAAGALSALGDDAITPLLGVLEKADLRTAAIEILDRVGWEPDKSKAAAYYWIGRKDWERCVAVGRPAIEPLLALLGDEKVRDQDDIARSLGRLRWKPDKGAKGAAYWIAKREWERCIDIGAPAVEPLIAALRDETNGAHTRLHIVQALGQIADQRAVPPLLDALLDQDPEVRSAAAHVLAAIGDPHIVDERVTMLIDTLQDQNANGWKRVAAAHALGEIGAERAVGPLLAVFQDAYPDLRAQVAHALGTIGDARAVEPLVKLFSDPETELGLRRAAAEALVALYASDSLGDAHKRTILALRDTITRGHHDVHTDVNQRGACYDYHDDAAMGVDFPL